MKPEISSSVEHALPENLFDEILERIQKDFPQFRFEHLELHFASAEEIRELNQNYRQKDYVTDVLSFTMDPPAWLGQIVICLEKAEENAQEIGHSLEQEVQFLFVHGLLHCWGYDHETPEEEKEMLAMAYALLGRKN